MKPSIFITRNLGANSPLKTLGNSFRIRGQSLLAFETIPITEKPDSDWLFFYSQQGVTHYSKQARPNLSQKIAAFGPKTALSCQEHEIKVHLIGNGKAEPTARALRCVIGSDTICFLRAKQSLKSVQALLSESDKVTDMVVYDNKSKADFDVAPSDILIFTSPLNAKTYFRRYPINTAQIVVAIGQTTCQTLKKLGVHDVKVPKKASEECLVDLITSIEN